MASAFKDQEISSRKPDRRDLLDFLLRNEDKILSKILPLSTGGFRFRKFKSPTLEDIASKELPELKKIAGERGVTSRAVDKNLSLSMRLLRKVESPTAKQAPDLAAVKLAERTLGKFTESTLDLFSKLRGLKSKAKLQKKFLEMKKDVAETSLRDEVLAGNPKLGSAVGDRLDTAIRKETSKRLKAIFLKRDK